MNAEAPWCDVPAADDARFEQLAWSAGLTVGGHLVDWADGEQPMSWYPQDRTYRLLGSGHWNVALDASNTLWFGGTYYSSAGHWASQPVHHTFSADVEIVEIASWAGPGACALDTEGGVFCVNESGPLEPQPFPNGPYRRIRGDLQATCAQRDDQVIECNDGGHYDFGPLRDFAVTENQHYTFEAGELVLHLCALTEAGAIQCVGPRYPPDLLASLPTQDPLLQ